MARLGNLVQKVRSKNAGPFWLTLDIFCATSEAYAQVTNRLDAQAIADRFGVDPAQLKRFDMADLNVVKISLPRPQVQGTMVDRDMHGASYASLLAEMEI